MSRAAMLALAMLAAGCVHPRPVGHFGENAFYLTREHYRVRYLPGEDRALLPPEWELASYAFDEAGRPVAARQEPAWQTAYDQQDLLAGARVRARSLSAERFDLYFEHRSGRAAIWARTVPIRRYWQAEPTARLAYAGVMGISVRPGLGPDLVGFDPPEYRALASTPEVRRARVDGELTQAYTFDVQRGPTLEGATRWRVTLLVLRSRHPHWRVGRARLDSLIVLGYATRPHEHELHRRAFESLVRRVDLAP